ncbi:hypothetical protein LWI29_006260 [Acer saccharum]|uniref:Reverse transcriptase/retrotransposon-derived protein RNase H-like domain-containing protein n=1 Tax=Acer saccharum TaxID=4024 RepID=A0AA39VGY5_ACESA|nr:hypothetical protein LWI29_006260 [Acer saccharum]
MGYIFREFLSDPDHIYKQARQEFFDMRCCSLKRKDIMFHYKRMSQRYHTLCGINDHSLKQVYVNSLPDDLQDEIQRKIDTSGRSLNDTSLGELHMYALSYLDKLYATQRFFSKMLTEDPSTTFVLQEDVSDSEYSGSSDYSSVPESYQANPLVSHFGPQAPVWIGPDKYSKPVDVIAYFDTGSHNTMMTPTVLPPEYWKSQEHHFRAADGKVFSTHLISRKKIGIQFFPSFTLWVHVLGTHLPDKDILLGWDVFCQCKSLRILPFDLSVHQVQQFHGIVNYVRDFIPDVSHYTSVLSTLLKKPPPPWSSSHTEAILKLKEISQSPPALTIPSSGQLVLQTDASDIFWGAVLIEDREGQRSYCGHASGKFKDSQQHYHTIYKEILVVKYRIQKLDFHLRTRNFIVEMDNLSFPKVLDFRNKIPHNPLLLRLKDWFARYDFTVCHVKGHHNIIADMLSRPPLTHLITPTGHYPLIYMASPSDPSSSHAGPSSSSPAIQDYSFPPELLATLSPDHQPSLDQIQSFAKAQLPVYLARINSQDCLHTVNNLSRPFLDPFIMPPFYYFSPQLLWFLWCLSVLHHHAIVFPLQALYGHLHDPSQ